LIQIVRGEQGKNEKRKESESKNKRLWRESGQLPRSELR